MAPCIASADCGPTHCVSWLWLHALGQVAVAPCIGSACCTLDSYKRLVQTPVQRIVQTTVGALLSKVSVVVFDHCPWIQQIAADEVRLLHTCACLNNTSSCHTALMNSVTDYLYVVIDKIRTVEKRKDMTYP